MSDELKVQIPEGYRWVKMNEKRTGKWLYQCAGAWMESQDQYSYSDWYYITPIEPPKPTENWLDDRGFELTGDCRAPSVGDIYADNLLGAMVPVSCDSKTSDTKPRWILRKKAPPKPEAVDVEIKTSKYDGWLEATNPNNDNPYTLASMPCIVGPDWAFAGFVWGDDGPSIQHYYLVEEHRVKYAKAVRFRRVQGGAK